MLAVLGADHGTERGYSIVFETAKAEKLSLIKHGVREYDHLFILPAKSKGQSLERTPDAI